MAQLFDINEFVEFAMRAGGVFLKDIVAYKKRPTHKGHSRLVAFAHEAQRFSFRLKKNLQWFRFRESKHKKIYATTNEADVHLYCGFTVGDLADPRTIYVPVDKNFLGEMTKLGEALAKDDKQLVLYCGFIFDKENLGNLAEVAHIRGRAIDVGVSGMTIKESFEYLKQVITDNNLKLWLAEFPYWLHIGWRATDRKFLEYLPTRRPCNHLIPVSTD